MRPPADDPYNQREILKSVTKKLELQRGRVKWAISGLRHSLQFSAHQPAGQQTRSRQADVTWRREVLRAQRLEYRTILRRFLRVRAAVRILDDAAQQRGAA